MGEAPQARQMREERTSMAAASMRAERTMTPWPYRVMTAKSRSTTPSTLDGSGSYDPDDDELTYAWSLETQPDGSNDTIDTATAVTASFMPSVAGRYVVRLDVADGYGGTDSDTLEVMVTPPEQDLPSAYAGPAQTVDVGATVELDGSRSFDPTGTGLSYAWELRSEPTGSTASLSSATESNTSFVADLRGYYVVDLTVSADGLTSPVDTVVIRAEPQPTSIDVDATAELVVTDQVIQSDVKGIGMNLTKIAGGTNQATNNIISGGGFEPLVYRRLIRIDSSGSDSTGTWFSWETNGGVNFWETLGTGFGDGATIRFFRIVDGSGDPLAWNESYSEPTGADHVELLGEATVPAGGYVAEEDPQRVYIDQDIEFHAGDYAILYLKKNEVPIDLLHPRVQEYYGSNNGFGFGQSDGISMRLVDHDAGDSLSFPGETYGEVSLQNANGERIYQYVFHPFDQGEGQWYVQLHPNAQYRFSVWLRSSDGVRVRSVLFGQYADLAQTNDWEPTSDWQQFTYEFTAPAYPTSGSHGGVGLEFDGTGSVDIDNLALARVDNEYGEDPNRPGEASLSPWLESVADSGPKPGVRFYPLSHTTSSVEALLGNYDRNPSYSVNSGSFTSYSNVTVPAMMEWAYATGDSPGTRSSPLLSFNVKYTEAEWWAIVEYLGVPYDSSTDTPQTKPYAYMRYQQRGHGEPWTDDFNEILIEYGNESWHNGAGGYGWDGFGPNGWVHSGGMEYGLFARHVFEENVKQNDLWRTHQLSDKIKFVLGANYDARLGENMSYGEAAVAANPRTSYLGHANYVGPKWETGDASSSTFDAAGLQETLVGMHTGMRELIQDATEACRELNGTTSARYRVLAYEGGPSGYWQNEDEPEIDENYGKSLAMGVAALDAWLYSSQWGYGEQYYLGYSSGRWWSSHTMPEAGGFLPHAGWLALTMRNRYALGQEMLAVDPVQTPAYERNPDERVPLISAYAIRSSNATSVFVLSRKEPGQHDGYDFGNGYTPVLLHLPFSDAPSRITRYALTHPDGSFADPAENNRFEENVAITSVDVPISAYDSAFPIDESTGGGAEGLPPGTVFLYVFEE